MDKQEMTNEENYHFDVTGYLIVPRADTRSVEGLQRSTRSVRNH